MSGESCAICGTVPHDRERRVLVDGKQRRFYCSAACLRVGVRTTQIAQRRARRRRWAWSLAFLLLASGVAGVRHYVRARLPARTPVQAAAPAPREAPPAEAPTLGPSWPPTDEEWLEQFAHATWAYPLPGPSRHRALSSAELVLADAAARCRTPGRCGVDLGGELWGEHVLAAHDGVVDRVQRNLEGAPGGFYVRIAHWGGAVFTWYFHLAALPTRLTVGTHVSAGDVIGLAGDTGAAGTRTHLRFALSVRPSSALPEVYWDPEPLMADWPLRTPARGSVAGLAALDGPAEHLAGEIERR